MGMWSNLTSLIATSAVGIVSVFMVIGGIVIMNIMLASVTERTREIGVRKAIGARRSEILFQFLIEALIISGLGALLGIAVAITTELLVQRLIPVQYGIHIPISGASIIAAVLLSSIAGIVFGYLPASRASKLEPTESLRYE